MAKKATWTTLPDFQGHEINELGEIRNKVSKRIMEPSVNQTGVRYVGINNTTLGKYQNRAVSVLVAETFCHRASVEDSSVLYLDGNRENHAASNLVWAPHHHVISYHDQIVRPEWAVRHRIVDSNNVIYRSYAHAAQLTGSLPSEIKYAVQYNDALSDDTHTNLVQRTSTGHIFRSV